MIYLASPYSSPFRETRDERFNNACLAVSKMLKKRLNVFSPIVHSHPVAEKTDIGHDFGVWAAWDFEMLDLCEEVWVLLLWGWDSSIGVSKEIARARAQNKNIVYLNPHELGRQLECEREKRSMNHQ